MMIGRIVGIDGVMNRDRGKISNVLKRVVGNYDPLGNATTGSTAAAVAVALETIIDDAITDETTGIAIMSATDEDAGAAMEVVDTKAANAIVITSAVSVPLAAIGSSSTKARVSFPAERHRSRSRSH